MDAKSLLQGLSLGTFAVFRNARYSLCSQTQRIFQPTHHHCPLYLPTEEPKPILHYHRQGQHKAEPNHCNLPPDPQLQTYPHPPIFTAKKSQYLPKCIITPTHGNPISKAQSLIKPPHLPVPSTPERETHLRAPLGPRQPQTKPVPAPQPEHKEPKYIRIKGQLGPPAPSSPELLAQPCAPFRCYTFLAPRSVRPPRMGGGGFYRAETAGWVTVLRTSYRTTGPRRREGIITACAGRLRRGYGCGGYLSRTRIRRSCRCEFGEEQH
ncbi:hypothetical protein EJ06DRAFT_164185 [Trichodelitschia bisporula]|uniref:Uncharacterized protein n=1 Tax=Trichodelitschia bisporula TaxID=703511 RepID=A0A6G1HM76_9PEZI|nr:hypothetical protein EJ06DRAFT_164185 [Trichodelitschia bisporula]